jgi:hypothetical protein
MEKLANILEGLPNLRDLHLELNQLDLEQNQGQILRSLF